MKMAPDQRNVESVLSDRSRECYATIGEKKPTFIMVIGLSEVQFSLFNKNRRLRRENPICLSRVWLQTELDDKMSSDQ